MSSMSNYTSSSEASTSPYGDSRQRLSSINTGTLTGPGDWNGNGLGYYPNSDSSGTSTSTDSTGDISPITRSSLFRDAGRSGALSDGSSVHAHSVRPKVGRSDSMFLDVSLSSDAPGTTSIPETADSTQKSREEPPSSAHSRHSGTSLSEILRKIGSEQRDRSPSSASVTSFESSDSTTSNTSLWSRAKSKISSFFERITNSSRYDPDEGQSGTPYEFSMDDMTPEDVLVGGSGNYFDMTSHDTRARTSSYRNYSRPTYNPTGDSSRSLGRRPSWAESMMGSDDRTQSVSGGDMYSLAVDPMEAQHVLGPHAR